MGGEHFLDFVQGLAAEVRRLEKLVFRALDQIADVVDVLGLEAVGGTNRELEIVDRTEQDRIERRRNVFVFLGRSSVGAGVLMDRAEHGELILEETPFDLRILLKDCWTILEFQAAKMELTFEPIAAGSITRPYVIGSPLHVRQIFTNILSNAIKYNKRGGKISVSARAAASTEDSVSYEFTIADTGIGMSQEYLEHIFEPFSQEDPGARTTYHGTGLGMSIVHRLVDSLGGTIRVESEKNVGSRFIFTLPFQLDPSPKSQNPAENEPPAADISGMHILIVEDNELNREIAQYLLEDAGATVTAVCNGLEGYQKFVSSPPETFDLILMDIMMPVMDGLEAATKIRSCDHPDALIIPIVAMSANAFSDDVLASKKAGMNEHLAKPLELNKLMQVLARFRM